MPLSRLLLPLCGLLLALAVTAATAAAPLYEAGELKVVAEYENSWMMQSLQVSRCSEMGGSLVPIVTEAVYTLVTAALDGTGVWSSFSYMGGSTMMSSSTCTTAAPSLSCIWYWDQGRYSGADSVVRFYRGNRDVADLPEAGMMTTAVANHWNVVSDTERCPCYKMERYGAVLRDAEGLPYWSDTDASSYSYRYRSGNDRRNYRLCGIDSTITTTTAKPPNSVASRPLVVGLPVAVALVVMALVAWS